MFLAAKPSRAISLLVFILSVILSSFAMANEQSKRIITLGSSITEIVFALGAQERIAAVDSTSRYPSKATKLPNVGYFRALNAEGVMALSPDLIILQEGSGPEPVLDVLRASGIKMVEVKDEFTTEGVIAKIKQIGAALQLSQEATRLAAKVENDFAATKSAIELNNQEEKPTVLYIISTMNGNIVAAGNNTSANAMIKMAGGTNVFGGIDGYKPVNAEAIIEAAPQIIVAMGRHGKVSVETLMATPQLKRTPAVMNKKVYVMGGAYLLGFGPRAPQALEDLHRLIYAK